MEKEVILTPEGLKKLEDELEELKSVKRREIASRIKQAIEFGDISENSEYEEAKNEQAFIEGRIATLEKMLRNARVIDDLDIDIGIVSIGSKVRVKDIDTGDEFEYVIVGSAEADPARFKISNESPIGRSLLGKTVGDRVDVRIPAGLLHFEVLGINK